MVKGNAFETGNALPIGSNPIGHAGLKMYIKEVSALDIKAPAIALASNGSDDVIAQVSYGKGTVLVVGDPWLYNEYVDGRKLPLIFENFEAAKNLTQWLLTNIK